MDLFFPTHPPFCFPVRSVPLFVLSQTDCPFALPPPLYIFIRTTMAFPGFSFTFYHACFPLPRRIRNHVVTKLNNRLVPTGVLRFSLRTDSTKIAKNRRKTRRAKIGVERRYVSSSYAKVSKMVGVDSTDRSEANDLGAGKKWKI